jgi:DNA-binding response OmpR family regulator
VDGVEIPPADRRAVEDGPVRATVLVVEDERRIRDLVRRYLERSGLTVLSTGSGAEALTLAAGADVDLVVLDLGLPDVPGEEVAQAVRARGDVPIVMLTARSATEDRIRGLELGADDYVIKPFSPRELTLRVHAVLRRMSGREPDRDATSYDGGALVVDRAAHAVTVRGRPVSLTPTEWALLDALTGAPGRVFSRYELVNRIRGYEFEGYERIVDTHVKNLRSKIEADPRHPRIVETVLGVGYRAGVTEDREGSRR